MRALKDGRWGRWRGAAPAGRATGRQVSPRVRPALRRSAKRRERPIFAPPRLRRDGPTCLSFSRPAGTPANEGHRQPSVGNAGLSSCVPPGPALRRRRIRGRSRSLAEPNPGGFVRWSERDTKRVSVARETNVRRENGVRLASELRSRILCGLCVSAFPRIRKPTPPKRLPPSRSATSPPGIELTG